MECRIVMSRREKIWGQMKIQQRIKEKNVVVRLTNSECYILIEDRTICFLWWYRQYFAALSCSVAPLRLLHLIVQICVRSRSRSLLQSHFWAKFSLLTRVMLIIRSITGQYNYVYVIHNQTNISISFFVFQFSFSCEYK